MCQKAEHAGVSFISVHGRTVEQRKQPPNLEAIRIIKDSVHIPVIENGDVKSLEDSVMVQQKTGVDGKLIWVTLVLLFLFAVVFSRNAVT